MSGNELALLIGSISTGLGGIGVIIRAGLSVMTKEFSAMRIALIESSRIIGINSEISRQQIEVSKDLILRIEDQGHQLSAVTDFMEQNTPVTNPRIPKVPRRQTPARGLRKITDE